MDSLEKKLKDTRNALSTDHHLPQCCEKNLILLIDTHLEELGVVSKEIQLERDNALEWVKENILKESYEESGRDTTGLDFEAAGMCHAIQVFVNRKILPKLVGDGE